MRRDEADAIDQLATGAVLTHNGVLFIVEDGPDADGDMTVGRLGARKVPASKMFDDGADCPAPGCDGDVITDGPGLRTCTEACLCWTLNHLTSGEECPERECEGEITAKSKSGDQYSLSCSSCGLMSFGPEYWREGWRSAAQEAATDAARATAEKHP